LNKYSKLLVIGLSVAILSVSPVFASGTGGQDSDNNQAAGSASSSVNGNGYNATSIGASIQGGSQNVAIGVSHQIITGNSGSMEDIFGVGGLTADGDGNTAIGVNSQVTSGNDNKAIGFGAQAGGGNNNTAIGRMTSAIGESTTAIGAGASATGVGSVALGAGSVATEAGTVSVGNSQYQRRITNVAPGIYSTDAVNMSQLRTLDDKVNRVGASAAAFSALAPLPYDPKEPTQYSAGIGTYNGTAAFAVGVYHYTQPDIMLNAAIGISNDGWEKQARVGISWRTGGSKAKEIAPAVEPKESIADRVKRILDENKAE
jgi:autotransporter adhesin